MKIVIDIPDELVNDHSIVAVDINYIKNGTVLPKGHGDLIDRNTIQMSAEKFHSLGDLYTAQWIVDDAPTVIEADKGE